LDTFLSQVEEGEEQIRDRAIICQRHL